MDWMILKTNISDILNKIVVQKTRLIFILFSSIVCVYFQVKGLGNDYRTFYSAGISVRELESPWDVNKGNEFSAYLNGPISALILSALSLFPFEISLFIVRITTLALIPYTLKRFLNSFHISCSSELRYSLSTLLILTFPIRACLEYGQLSGIYLSCFVIFIAAIKSKDKGFHLFAFGLVSCIILDYKPQIFLPILFFLPYRRIQFLFGFMTGVTSAWFINFFVTGDTFFNAWLDAILARSQTVSNRGDQMSLYSLLNLNQTESTIVLSVLVSTAAFSIKRSGESKNFDRGQRILLSLLLWSALTPFSHPTDMLISQLFISALTVRLSGSGNAKLVLLALGCGAVWSSSLIPSSIVFLSLFLLSRKSIFSNRHLNLLIQFLILTPPVIFSFISIRFPSLEGAARQLLNYLSILIPVAMLLHRKVQRRLFT
jgi:hypothetical protein